MRIAAFVASGLLALFSLGLLAAGGLLLWADSETDEHGFLSTSSERFATNSHALSTDNLDADFDGIDWIVDRDRFGELRLTVGSNVGEPVFVGVAPTTDVDRYLRGTSHDLVTDIDFSPFRADYRRLDGDRRPARPASQTFWAASTQGDGRQTLTWDVENGDWSIVVMNADASRGIDADVKAAAKVGFLDSVGWGALISGLIALSLSALLAVVGIRRRPAVPA
jgi:hypothetical protein